MFFRSLQNLWPSILQTRLDKTFEYYRSLPDIKNNQALVNANRGRCFILGNGPSLKNTNLSRLATEETFVVNYFCHHPQYALVKPKFYILLDPVVFTRPLLWKNFYPRVSKNLDQDTKLIFSWYSKKIVEKQKLFPKNRIFYAAGNYTQDSQPDQFDFAGRSQFVDSSVPFCLLLAAQLGFKSIYLLGMDMNYLDGETHFYPEFRHREGDPYLLYHRDNASRANILAETLGHFKKIRKHFDEKGVKVFNATPGGYLDVFPRRQLSVIFR